MKKKNLFDFKKNWLINSIKVTVIFIAVEIVAHWMVATHHDKGRMGHIPYARGSGGDFVINNWILYGVLPLVWIFLLMAARAYALDKKETALKRLNSDFPYAKGLITTQRFDEFDLWFAQNQTQMRKWEKKQLLDFRDFSSNNLDN